MLRTQVIRTIQELELYSDAWTHLVERSVSALVFQTPQWAIGWWRALQATSELFCVAMFDEARLVGFAPWCIVRTFGVRVVQYMGGQANDANALLVERGYAEPFGNGLSDVLAANRAEWDAIYLTPTSVDDPLSDFGERLTQPYAVARLLPTALPLCDLPETWERYWMGLSHKRRQTWMYSRRHLERKGHVSFRVITDAEGVAKGIRQLLAVRAENWQMRDRYKELIRLQRTPQFLETLVAVCRQLAVCERAWLGQLCLDGKPIGWEFGICQNGALWEYLTTYDRAFAVYSPGVWVALEMTRAAIAHGMSRIYWGRGEQPYKFMLGAKPAFALPLLAGQNNARGLAFLGTVWAYDRAVGVYHARQKLH